MHSEPVAKTADVDTSAPARFGDTLGYARVSTHDQYPEAQNARLIEAGAIRVFTDVISGKRFDRPGLAELIDHARSGDRLCVTRLDRLGRSLRELLETVDGLNARGIHLASLEERLDTSSAAGNSGTSARGERASMPAQRSGCIRSMVTRVPAAFRDWTNPMAQSTSCRSNPRAREHVPAFSYDLTESWSFGIPAQSGDLTGRGAGP